MLSREAKVHDAAAARALADERMRAIIGFFSERPTSISAAAVGLRTSVERLHHHVRKLHRIGLLEIAETVRRQGRPIRLYRAVSNTFFVPDELLPDAFAANRHRLLRERLTKAHFRSGDGTVVTLTESGSELRRRSGDRSDRNVTELWLSIDMVPSKLGELERELNALLTRFDEPGHPGARPFLLHAAAVPIAG